MAEVFIAAAPGEDAQARGLAEALGVLGFKANAGTPAENEISKTVGEAKCVLLLWTRGAAEAPWLTALAVLAQERKKLVSAEAERDATPTLFRTSPRIDLAARDRTLFKQRFQALVVELDKLTPTKGDAKALPDALIKARAALLSPRMVGGMQARTVGILALGVVVLFGAGFGAGRVINAVRSGEFLVATPHADAATTTSARTSAPRVERTPFGVTPQQLQTETWRESADRIDANAASQIKEAASRGDGMAQALACLGHLAGAEGFLPSPTAAREQCDASAAQHQPAGLYLSWVLRRTAPHAGLDEATARARLAEAARQNWPPAIIDYAQTLAPDWRAPVADQAEAGRLWLAAAEHNDPRGQFFYARWLRDSPAGPQDPTAAIPYLERAAQAGQVDALHMLATLYRDGIGAPRNEGRAKVLYEQAARQNHTPSMFNLADMLRRGTPEERSRAVTLYAQLACMPDERQIQPMALARLRALHESASCR